MESRLIGSVIGIAILIAGAAIYKMRARDDSIDMHSDMLAQIEQLPDYATHASLYNTWLDTHHDECFEANFSAEVHSIRRGGVNSEFDAQGYLDCLFGEMIQDAEAAGYTEQAEHLRQLHEEVYIIDRD